MCIRISAESISGEWLPVDVPGWAWCDIMMVLADHVCVTRLGDNARDSQCKYCTKNGTILGGLAASVGRSMTARFEVSLTHEITMRSETKVKPVKNAEAAFFKL